MLYRNFNNDNWYYANELVECNWIERNNCLVWRDYDLDEEISNEISVSVPKSKKITLVFEKISGEANVK